MLANMILDLFHKSAIALTIPPINIKSALHRHDSYLYSRTLCPLRPLWFNHSSPSGNDITQINADFFKSPGRTNIKETGFFT